MSTRWCPCCWLRTLWLATHTFTHISPRPECPHQVMPLLLAAHTLAGCTHFHPHQSTTCMSTRWCPCCWLRTLWLATHTLTHISPRPVCPHQIVPLLLAAHTFTHISPRPVCSHQVVPLLLAAHTLAACTYFHPHQSTTCMSTPGRAPAAGCLRPGRGSFLHGMEAEIQQI